MKQYRYLLLITLSLGLQACAIPQRGGPPAPIVDAIRPRPLVTRLQRVPVPITPPPVVAAPVPRAPVESTRVYAYAPPPEQAAPMTVAPASAAASPRSAPAPMEPVTVSPPAALPPITPAPVPMPLVETAPVAASLPAPLPVSSPPASAPVAVPLNIPDIAAPQLPPAIAALVQQAEQQRLNRDHSGAAATLERALRLQPQRADAAYIWNRLARVRLEQGMAVQANTLAVRSNTFASEQPQIKRNNWLMIAAARRQGGDVQGALEAERHANGG